MSPWAKRVGRLAVNESIYIPKLAPHRLENKSSEIMQIIEVQCGTYLGEDDIVRLEDKYARVEQAGKTGKVEKSEKSG